MSAEPNGESNGDSPRFFTSIRAMGSTTVAMLQNRVELFSVELKEQKFHLVQLLILAGVGIFLAVMTLVAISATIVYLFPPEYRLYAFLGLDLFYLVGTVATIFKLKSGLSKSALPFSETIGELKKDREWLKNLS